MQAAEWKFYYIKKEGVLYKTLLYKKPQMNGPIYLNLQSRKNSDTSFNHHVFPDLFPSINFIVNLHSLMGI